MQTLLKNIKGTAWRLWRTLIGIPSRFELFLTQSARDRLLRKLIKGKRVLIIGSGQSAKELEAIPEDMLIFACNTSPEVLYRHNLRTHMDLYLAGKTAFENYRGTIENVLEHVTINIFVSKDTSYIRSRKDIKNYSRLIHDRAAGNKSNYYLKRLIAPIKVDEIVGSSRKKSTTSGVALLQYALYFEASEAYMIGIDLDTRDSAFFPHTHAVYTTAHKDIDQNFMRIVAKRYPYVYSASSTSPLTDFIPFKKLT